LKRNNVYLRPIDLDLSGEQRTGVLDQDGFELKEGQEKVISVVILINILFSIFIYSLALVFKEFEEEPVIKSVEIISFLIFLLEIVINLTTVRVRLGRKLTTYREIGQGYKQ
jgi:uncharacterized membrane protein YbhN (UPF0104 family)